ncbi:MAG: hypothetical protein QM607_13125 [Microbacterium sp.]
METSVGIRIGVQAGEMSWNDVVAGTAAAGEDPVGAYRAIRRTGPPDAPVDGVIATVGGESVLLVDAADARDWPGWSYGEAQHVLAPLDIARAADGHLLVLPRCECTVDDWLRRSRGAPSGGETITLAVSLLRGSTEAWEGVRGDAEVPRGVWWLTADARPVVALGEGEPVEEAAAALLDRVVALSSDRALVRVLEETIAALGRPRALHRTSAELEDRLFEQFAPQPIVLATTQADAPVQTDQLRAQVHRRLPAVAASALQEGPGALLLALLAQQRERLPGRSRTASRSRSGHRTPLILGGLAAGAVLLGGWFWPGADSQEPAETPSPVASRATATAPPQDETPEAATLRLADVPADADVALIDDFGDVAVTRYDDDDGTHHVVLERRDGTWTIREVYDDAVTP